MKLFSFFLISFAPLIAQSGAGQVLLGVSTNNSQWGAINLGNPNSVTGMLLPSALPSSIDLTGRTFILPKLAGPSATCLKGQLYFDEDDSLGTRLKICEEDNKWSYALTTSGIGPATDILSEHTSIPPMPTTTGISHLYFRNGAGLCSQTAGGSGEICYSAGTSSPPPSSGPTQNSITILAAVGSPSGAALNWNTGTFAPSAACVYQTLMDCAAVFPDQNGQYSIETPYVLPATFTGTVGVRLKWRAGATVGSVVWSAQIGCRGDGEAFDAPLNSPYSITDTTKSVANILNDAIIPALSVTGCAPGELAILKISRDRSHTSDTITGPVQLISVDLTIK